MATRSIMLGLRVAMPSSSPPLATCVYGTVGCASRVIWAVKRSSNVCRRWLAPSAPLRVKSRRHSGDRPVPLAQWLASCTTREEALHRAHTESGLRMSDMAGELSLSVSRVSRLNALAEQAKGKT